MTCRANRAGRLLTLACGAAALAGCERETPPPPPAPPPEPVVAAPSASPPPVVTPPLDRAGLIESAREAADSLAAGAEYPARVTALAGRDFRLTLPFGCAGPSAADVGLGYVFDSDARTLKLTARPQVWTDTPWAQALAPPDGAPPEAVEGFWLRRPWLTAETCPAQAAGLAQEAGLEQEATDSAPSLETLGLAQAFGPDSSRLLRRGSRPYEITRPLPADAPAPTGGFRLVLEGRVAAGGQRPIRCRSAGPDRRPVCLILVEFARVAFETPAGEPLEAWTS